jgi:transposase
MGGRPDLRLVKPAWEKVLTNLEILIGLPGYQITGLERKGVEVRILARYGGQVRCPHCQGTRLHSKGRYERAVRHEDLGARPCVLVLEARKWFCLSCQRQFRQRFPGILPWQRSSEAFQKLIFGLHRDGINRSRLGRREGIAPATVERHFERGLARQFKEWHPARCPPVLGIDEHFFTRKKGFATTLCDLRKHKIYDVVLGRSEASLEAYLQRLEGRETVRVVCMDLSSTYRALVKKYFPRALIVADRFHVIRLINQHFLACWRDLDREGSKNRGLLSLMRRHQQNLKPEQQPRLAEYLRQHPVLEAIYQHKQQLCELLKKKNQTRKQGAILVPQFLHAVAELREAILPPLVTLGNTLGAWAEEIGRMWRFTRNNGITEGFHNKMETINRQAYGFRNFNNYRMRVKVLCA